MNILHTLRLMAKGLAGHGPEDSFQVINRAVLVLKPKQPYVDWVNSRLNALDDRPETIESLRAKECVTLLIPECDVEETDGIIEALSPALFRLALADWDTDKKRWPEKRDYETFKEWFDVELHTVVMDILPEPVEKG